MLISLWPGALFVYHCLKTSLPSDPTAIFTMRENLSTQVLLSCTLTKVIETFFNIV